jgi:glutamine amidotransferase
VVLPGVGAIRDCMAELQRLGMDEVVREVARSKPLLGVCVGMQALLEFSAENGGVDCLGLLPGRLDFFGDAFRLNPPAEHLKVPHMGWNQVHQADPAHPMWQGINQESAFYFVHSYFLPGAMDGDVCAATTEYGQRFCSAVTRGNIFATQFHPEKSAAAGLRLYRNFLAWDGN